MCPSLKYNPSRPAIRKPAEQGRAFEWLSSWLRLLAGVGLCLWMTGCAEVGFYHQAVKGQCQILYRQTSIAKLIDDPKTPPELRQQFQLVLQLREFAASELGLDPKGHYLRYADLERPYVVWDIYAAPEFSLEPKKWWYPVVGRLSYRGYFSEKQARKHAARLEARGYDVFVGGVDAYSTLGWFKDPLLNTFIHREEADLADLIFHELAHQKVFLPGDTDFNEAFAVTVAREGVRRWLAHRRDEQRLSAWEQQARREEQFVSMVLETRKKLEAAYGQFQSADRAAEAGSQLASLGHSPRTLRELKAGIFAGLRDDYAALKRSWNDDPAFDRWFEWPVNNARLNAEATYFELVPSFQNRLDSLGGSLPDFYEAMRSLRHLTEKERLEAVRSWKGQAHNGGEF